MAQTPKNIETFLADIVSIQQHASSLHSGVKKILQTNDHVLCRIFVKNCWLI